MSTQLLDLDDAILFRCFHRIVVKNCTEVCYELSPMYKFTFCPSDNTLKFTASLFVRFTSQDGLPSEYMFLNKIFDVVVKPTRKKSYNDGDVRDQVFLWRILQRRCSSVANLERLVRGAIKRKGDSMQNLDQVLGKANKDLTSFLEKNFTSFFSFAHKPFQYSKQDIVNCLNKIIE